MKYIITIASFIFLMPLSKAIATQPNEPLALGINLKFNINKDTTRTFGILSDDKDSYIQNFNANIQSSDLNDFVGLNMYEDIQIPGLGSDLKIIIRDGILTKDEKKGIAYFDPFKSQADKTKQLKKLEENQVRIVEIEIQDATGKNIINSLNKQRIAEDFIANKMKA